MNDDTTPTEPDASQDYTSAPAGDPPQQDEPLGDGGVKALKAEREARKTAEKAAQEALAKVREFEDRDKTELEKLQEKATQAESRAQEQTTAAWREALRTAHQLSDEDVETFLTGSDAETLKRQAGRLAELRTHAHRASARTPVEALQPGATPVSDAAPSDMSAWMRGKTPTTGAY